VKGNLTQRTDTGRINTSPVSATSPIIRLQHGCNHTIEIPGVHCVSEHIKVYGCIHPSNGFHIQLKMLMEMILGVDGQTVILENVLVFVKFFQQH